jgi:hypothetical protein
MATCDVAHYLEQEISAITELNDIQRLSIRIEKEYGVYEEISNEERVVLKELLNQKRSTLSNDPLPCIR